MKIQILALSAITSAFLLQACDTSNPDRNRVPSSSLVDTKPGANDTLMLINGKPLTKSLFDSVYAELSQKNPEHKIPQDKVLEGLIARELLEQEAENQNLFKDPAVAEKLENARRDILIAARVDQFRKTVEVTEDEIKKEYDVRVSSLPKGKIGEFKARHILLETEEAAKDVIAKLSKGAKFEDLAKKFSKDPSAKQTGGELGWFNTKQMVAEFTNAVSALKNGQTTSAPVKTQYGWHVIQREDYREEDSPPPPPYDAIKDQFRTAIINQKLQKHVEELKAAAKIERISEPTAPQAAPGSAEATPHESLHPEGNGSKPTSSVQ